MHPVLSLPNWEHTTEVGPSAGLFFCAWIEGRASESAGSFGGKNHTDTEYTEDQAISSALLLVILVFSWSKPNHGLAGSPLHITFNSNRLGQALGY